MATFDSLGYARFLRDGGVPHDQAETHADAARKFIAEDLVTKGDLQTGLDMLALRMETMTLRLAVRMGVILAAGLSVMTAVLGFLMRSH
ncbi:MAG: hypothetical protein JO038_03110 [Alphaproteobacteria bacterium]|nr:hypothetical protein [Alphaproteobacteria bacterium]